MKRLTLLLVVAFLVSFGLLQFATREEGPEDRESPGEELTTGKTVSRPGVDEEAGEAETWKITKRYVARADLPDLVLPTPRPRETAPSALTESSRALDAMALESWKHGDVEGALELFEEAVKADPDDALVRSDYGRLLTLMTAYDKAYPHLARAAELEPDDPAVWLDLQTLYERDILLERAYYARKRAEELAGGRKIARDERGFWTLEAERSIP